MKKKGDHRLRNSAQYERVVELLIMHKAKWTPRQILLHNEICLGVRFALCIILSSLKIKVAPYPIIKVAPYPN